MLKKHGRKGTSFFRHDQMLLHFFAEKRRIVRLKAK